MTVLLYNNDGNFAGAPRTQPANKSYEEIEKDIVTTTVSNSQFRGMFCSRFTVLKIKIMEIFSNSIIVYPPPPDDDLFVCLRHFLRFGRFIGIVPFQGVFQSDLSKVKFRWTSAASFMSILITAWLLMNTIVGGHGLMRLGGRNATEWAWAAESFVFYTMGLFVYSYFICRGERFINILNKWRRLSIEFTFEDKQLYRNINWVAGLIYTSAILENAVLQLIFFRVNDPSIESNLETYLKTSHGHWAYLIPKSDTLAIFVLLSNKFCLYGWNFVDILIIALSRAIYYKFKMLIQKGEEYVTLPDKSDPTVWKQITRDHFQIWELLQEFETFLSPLIFASYTINTYYICLQLHLGLTSSNRNGRVLENVYAIWSFIHLIVRVLLVSISAARIHDHAHSILRLLHKCPFIADSPEVEKARHYIGINKIGLTGLGCFIITKPFILHIIGVVFTFEIVLLQGSIPNNSSC